MPAWSMFGRGRSSGARSRRRVWGRCTGGTARGGAGTLLDSSETTGAGIGAGRRVGEAATGETIRTGGGAVRGTTGEGAAMNARRCEARSRPANTPPRASSAMAAATSWRRDPDRSRCSNDGSSDVDRPSGGERSTARGAVDGAAFVGETNRALPSLSESAALEFSRICVLATTAAAVPPRPATAGGSSSAIPPGSGGWRDPTAAAQARRPIRSAPRVRRASHEGRSLPAPPAGRI